MPMLWFSSAWCGTTTGIAAVPTVRAWLTAVDTLVAAGAETRRFQ
jgi:hypothetical protein